MVSFGAALRWGPRRFAAASTPRTQAEVQRFYKGFTQSFGQPVTNADITRALRRVPIAHRIVFAVAHDIFDNWFEVEPLEEGIDKEKFNEQVQKVLLLFDARDIFTRAAVFERVYGWSIIVIVIRIRL